MTLNNLPNPPPGAHQVQLELWRRVLHRRYDQIGTLSPSTFHTFANDVASDYTNSLRTCSQIDLSTSHYSSFLLPLRHNDNNTNNDNNNTAKQITFHFLALFYTAIDERSSPPERQFSIDVVKRAFSLLDDVLKRNDKSNKRDSSDGDGDGEDYVVGKHGRDEDEEEEEEELVAEMPKKKHARKDYDDANTSGMDDSGDSQNNQADLSNKEAEHETEQQSNIMSTGEADEEGGETVAFSNPSSASNSKQHHESDEGAAADEMQVDGNNDHDNMKSNSQQTKEFRIRTVREVLEEDAKKQKKQVQRGSTEPRMEPDDLENATQSNELEEATVDVVGREGGKLGTPLNISDNVSQNPGDAEVSDDGAEHPFNEEVGNSFEETEDNSVEEIVPANDDVAKPAESDVMREEPQLKESDGAEGPHGEGQNIDDVIETEAASEPTIQAGEADIANAIQPVLGAVGTNPIAQTPLPPPRVYSGLRHLNFYADNFVPSANNQGEKFLVSGSLHPRGPCTVQYDTGYHHLNYCATLDDETSLSINGRLSKWEPYWKIVDVLCRRDTVTDIGAPTKVSTKTALCKDQTGIDNPPLSCAMVTVDLSKEARNSTSATETADEESSNGGVWGVDWGKETEGYKSGDRRLLLRTLPLTRSSAESTQRADCHLWPKGTFLQLKIGDEVNEHVVEIKQRQELEPKKWSGQSAALDLTPFVKNADLPFDIKLCCREAVRKQEVPPYKTGTKVSKMFECDETGETRPFSGVVESYDPHYKLYRIVYEDDDKEDLTREDVSDILVAKHDQGDPPTIGSYAVHVSICEYVDPARLFDELTGMRVGNVVIPSLSLESVKQKAIKALEQQIVVDCDSDSDGNEAQGSNNDCLVFSLLCPFTKTVIDTPVRGKDCDHLQCFDLSNFLHANKNPSAGRWRCGICQSFLCCEDLVRCGLFDAMLRDLRTDVSSTRHKVSFMKGGRWKLMDQKKVAKTEITVNNREDRCDPEVIDLSDD